CRAAPAVCRQRLERRANEPCASDGRLSVFDDFVARFEPVEELPAAEHVVVDTTRPADQTLAALRAHLSTWPKGLVA
ncbi:MAG: hypothetical protein ACRELB_22545, partial [Polyangiaceae bacterium]